MIASEPRALTLIEEALCYERLKSFVMPLSLQQVVCAVALAFGCAPAASTAPLGGEEWLRPERHIDRRSTGAGETEASTSSRTAASVATTPPKAAATGSTSSPTIVTQPGDVRFGFLPFARGNTITIETHFKINAIFSTSFQGLSTSEKAELDARERIEIKVIEASAEGIRELEVHYATSKSVFRFGDLPDDEDSNAGKRYRVTFADGKPRVMKDRGTLEPDEDKGVVFDLGSVTGYVPLVRFELPKSLSPGFSARLDAPQLTKVFGSLETVKFDGGFLELRGRDAKRPDSALFDCGLPVRIERDGATFFADLKGSCSARVNDSRPLEIRLSGPLRAASGAAFTSASTLTGDLEAEVIHRYSAEPNSP